MECVSGLVGRWGSVSLPDTNDFGYDPTKGCPAERNNGLERSFFFWFDERSSEEKGN